MFSFRIELLLLCLLTLRFILSFFSFRFGFPSPDYIKSNKSILISLQVSNETLVMGFSASFIFHLRPHISLRLFCALQHTQRFVFEREISPIDVFISFLRAFSFVCCWCDEELREFAFGEPNCVAVLRRT